MPIQQAMNREDLWLEGIEWIEDDESLDELLHVLHVVPYDANAASGRDGVMESVLDVKAGRAYSVSKPSGGRSKPELAR
jgi:hypothetical protein